jgi:hypothetical protein
VIACANAWLSDAVPAVSAAALAGGEPTWTPRASSSAEPPPIVEVEDAAILPRSVASERSM